MAVTTRETIIANPGKRKGSKMARKLSKKQIAAGFGGKRRKSAVKRKRKSSASHRPRSKPKSNPAPRKKRRTVVSSAPRKRRKKKAAVKRRKNVGGIFALTANPAKGRKMARTKKRRKSSAARSNAGTRRKARKNPGRRHSRRSNPGSFGGPMEWVTGGAGAVIGALGAPALTQAVLGSSNTGPVGYLANAAATGILAFAAHFAAPRQKFLAMGIVFGGAGSIIRRVIGDYSLLGSYSSQVGMGDYLMNFNYPVPQYLAPGNSKQLTPYGGAPASIPVVSNSASGAGMGSSLYGNRLY